MLAIDSLGLGSLARVTSTRAVLTLLAASAVVFVPATFTTGPFLVRSNDRVGQVARVAIVGVGLPVALILAASGAFSPFLYFQF